LVEPRVLGVGYHNIADLGSGNLLLGMMLTIGVWKFVAWSVSLGSGTSGGTLAPLFTIGGCCGALAGAGLAIALPSIAPEPGLAALIGMAATFAGASHAVLASAIFVAEATRQPLAVVPLLIGCTVGYVVARLAQRTSIMTEKIARRGVAVPSEYEADALASSQVAQRMTFPVETLSAAMTVVEAQARFVAGGGRAAYPVVDHDGLLVGVVTRRELLADDVAGRRVGELVRRTPTVIQSDSTVREAVDLLLAAGVGRLVVVAHDAPRRILGIVSRGDVLGVHLQVTEDDHRVGQALDTGSAPVVAAPRRTRLERVEHRRFVGRIRTIQWLRRVRHPTRVYLRRLRGADAPHPPRPALAVVMASWVGALLAIGFVGWMADAAHASLMLASFGASAVLLFGMPESPFSQPRNTIIGHLLAACIGMAAANLIGENWMAMALAVATALGAMKLARAVHPPAGSTAIIALHLHPGLEFLILPVLAGSLLLVGLAALYNNVFEHRRYPLRWT
jgi:CBS-domain-containing membrane protein